MAAHRSVMRIAPNPAFGPAAPPPTLMRVAGPAFNPSPVRNISQWERLPPTMLRSFAMSKAAGAPLQDPLTSLLNRTAFQALLDGYLESKQALGLILLNLDAFRDINDVLGYEAGDDVLRQVAQALASAASAKDMVARVGGDEFAIIVPDLSRPSELNSVIGRFQTAVNQDVRTSRGKMRPSASFGAALYPLHCDSPAKLMQFSDVALREAKRQGRGQPRIFRKTSLKAVQLRNAMLSRAALCLKSAGKLRVYYQPKVDLAQKKLVGFEALIRCIDEKGRVRGPGWISAAFDDPLLSVAIGDRVRKECFAFSKRLLDEGRTGCRVALNVTSWELRSPQWAENFLREAFAAGVPTTALEVEVTESVVLSGRDNRALRALYQLHDAGVTITLDDFGTGFACLSHLQACPIDSLKIDRSFTQNLLTRESQGIVKAIIGLGRSLGLVVVAEGVENSDQHRILTDLGCDHGQGFLYGHAVPADSNDGNAQTHLHQPH